ncbi:MAG: hypothetical protein IPN17_18800 [Deltaproteobacteria bacterium]|nr:hypothetical protein [Deltaproteobacteria bacterium]
MDRTASEIEATTFAKTYALARVTGDDASDPRLRGMKRVAWKAQLLGDAAELEALFGDDEHSEVVNLWIDRRALQDRTLAAGAMQAYARFLSDAAGAPTADDQKTLGNALAVSYDQTRTFAAVLDALPWIPRDGAGAATEVFLGKRMEATATFSKKTATLVVRNEEGGRRLHIGVATQRAVFDLGRLLFSARWASPRATARAWPGGRRRRSTRRPSDGASPWSSTARASPWGASPVGTSAFAHIARTAKVELLIEPTRGMVGVLLKIDPDWVESSENNYFAALELLTAFVAEGLGDAPDARSRVEIGDLFSCAPGDDVLFNAIKKELPFILKGKNGAATAVFLGEEDLAEASLDEGQVLVRLMEGADGWLECAFLLNEYLEAIDAVV